VAPGKIASHEDEVRNTLHRASRGRIAQEKVDLLLERAKRSIGSRQAESLATEQLRSVFDYTETIQRQISEIEEQLESRIEELDSPLLSLGISPVLAATIHAESDPIADFPGPDQYVAYTGLDPSVRESGDTIRCRSKISKRARPSFVTHSSW